MLQNWDLSWAPDLDKVADGIARGNSSAASMFLLMKLWYLCCCFGKKWPNVFHSTCPCFSCSSLLYRDYCCRSVGKHKAWASTEPPEPVKDLCFKEAYLKGSCGNKTGISSFGR